MSEGIDFSTTAGPNSPSVATLKSLGKQFVGRYAVNDKSPTGRGITADEYKRFTAGGIDVFLYWESTSGWMLDGFNAGALAAVNAQNNLVAAGMPIAMPVYFACDFDATPEQQVQIDACLKGAASVMGADRVGVYGGFYIVQRCAQNKTAKWFAQTLAWSGSQWFSGNHLEQYGFNAIIDGTNCDNVRAKQDNYGQASKFGGTTGVTYPEGMDAGIAKQLFGSFKAANGVTVSYSEGDELAKLWLASGSYGKISNVIFAKDPTVTRIYWVFSDGNVYWRPNDSAPIRKMKGA